MKSLIVFLLLSLCHNTSFAGVDGWRMNQFTGKPDYYQTGIDSTTIEAIAVSTTALAAQTSALDISTQALASRATALESSTSTLEGRVDGLEISTATLDSTLAAEILVRQALSTNVAVDTTTLNNDKVPYTGATGDVDLGAYKIIAASASVTELNLNGVARTTWPGGASLTDYNEWTSSNSFSSILISSGSHGLGDDLLAAGAGSRMFFYPKKSAIRGGQVTGTAWDDANIGNQSVGFGTNCTASAQYTNCVGNANSATYYQASAFGGSGNAVSGQSSFIGGGEGGVLSGSYSAIIGGNLVSVTGSQSAAVSGGPTTVSGNFSASLGGTNITISGASSGAGGEWVENAADHSFAWGKYVGLSSAADGSILFGRDSSSVKTYADSDTLILHNMDVRISTNTGNKGIKFQDNTVQYSAAPRDNAIINGSFSLWQRLTSSTTYSGAIFYGADRFWFKAGTGAQDTYALADADSYGIAVSSAAKLLRGGGTGSAVHQFGTTLETRDSIALRGKTLVWSFYALKGSAFNAASSPLEAKVRYGTGTNQAANGSWTSSTTIVSQAVSPTTSLARYSYAFNVPINARQLELWLEWQPNSTAGSANDYLLTTGWQLESGSYPSELKFKSQVDELAACQRYYFKTFRQSVSPAQATGDFVGSISYRLTTAGTATGNSVYVAFPVTMRAAQTPTFYSPASANTTWYNSFTAADSGTPVIGYQGENGITVFNAQVAGDSAGQTCFLHMTVDAEL